MCETIYTGSVIIFTLMFKQNTRLQCDAINQQVCNRLLPLVWTENEQIDASYYNVWANSNLMLIGCDIITHQGIKTTVAEAEHVYCCNVTKVIS